jgi:hypothetical protein
MAEQKTRDLILRLLEIAEARRDQANAELKETGFDVEATELAEVIANANEAINMVECWLAGKGYKNG